MLNNHTYNFRECCEQAAHCVQQAEAQNDPKVQKQFLELARRWLLLARGLVPQLAMDENPAQGFDGRHIGSERNYAAAL